jgi:predicted  nucleic acid-binding Zn-ribbon protein
MQNWSGAPLYNEKMYFDKTAEDLHPLLRQNDANYNAQLLGNYFNNLQKDDSGYPYFRNIDHVERFGQHIAEDPRFTSFDLQPHFANIVQHSRNQNEKIESIKKAAEKGMQIFPRALKNDVLENVRNKNPFKSDVNQWPNVNQFFNEYRNLHPNFNLDVESTFLNKIKRDVNLGDQGLVKYINAMDLPHENNRVRHLLEDENIQNLRNYFGEHYGLWEDMEGNKQFMPVESFKERFEKGGRVLQNIHPMMSDLKEALQGVWDSGKPKSELQEAERGGREFGDSQPTNDIQYGTNTNQPRRTQDNIAARLIKQISSLLAQDNLLPQNLNVVPTSRDGAAFAHLPEIKEWLAKYREAHPHYISQQAKPWQNELRKDLTKAALPYFNQDMAFSQFVDDPLIESIIKSVENQIKESGSLAKYLEDFDDTFANDGVVDLFNSDDFIERAMKAQANLQKLDDEWMKNIFFPPSPVESSEENRSSLDDDQVSNTTVSQDNNQLVDVDRLLDDVSMDWLQGTIPEKYETLTIRNILNTADSVVNSALEGVRDLATAIDSTLLNLDGVQSELNSLLVETQEGATNNESMTALGGVINSTITNITQTLDQEMSKVIGMQEELTQAKEQLQTTLNKVEIAEQSSHIKGKEQYITAREIVLLENGINDIDGTFEVINDALQQMGLIRNDMQALNAAVNQKDAKALNVLMSNIESARSNLKQYMDVEDTLSEDFQQQLQLIRDDVEVRLSNAIQNITNNAEGQQILQEDLQTFNNSLQALKGTVIQNNADLDRYRQQVNELAKGVGNIGGDVSDIKAQIDNVVADVKSANTSVAKVSEDLQALRNSTESRLLDHIQILANNTATVEGYFEQIESLTNKVDKIQNFIINNELDLKNYTNFVTEINQEIEEVTKQMSTSLNDIENDLGAIHGDVTEVKADVKALQERTNAILADEKATHTDFVSQIAQLQNDNNALLAKERLIEGYQLAQHFLWLNIGDIDEVVATLQDLMKESHLQQQEKQHVAELLRAVEMQPVDDLILEVTTLIDDKIGHIYDLDPHSKEFPDMQLNLDFVKDVLEELARSHYDKQFTEQMAMQRMHVPNVMPLVETLQVAGNNIQKYAKNIRESTQDTGMKELSDEIYKVGEDVQKKGDILAGKATLQQFIGAATAISGVPTEVTLDHQRQMLQYMQSSYFSDADKAMLQKTVQSIVSSAIAKAEKASTVLMAENEIANVVTTHESQEKTANGEAYILYGNQEIAVPISDELLKQVLPQKSIASLHPFNNKNAEIALEMLATGVQQALETEASMTIVDEVALSNNDVKMKEKFGYVGTYGTLSLFKMPNTKENPGNIWLYNNGKDLIMVSPDIDGMLITMELNLQGLYAKIMPQFKNLSVKNQAKQLAKAGDMYQPLAMVGLHLPEKAVYNFSTDTVNTIEYQDPLSGGTKTMTHRVPLVKVDYDKDAVLPSGHFPPKVEKFFDFIKTSNLKMNEFFNGTEWQRVILTGSFEEINDFVKAHNADAKDLEILKSFSGVKENLEKSWQNLMQDIQSISADIATQEQNLILAANKASPFLRFIGFIGNVVTGLFTPQLWGAIKAFSNVMSVAKAAAGVGVGTLGSAIADDVVETDRDEAELIILNNIKSLQAKLQSKKDEANAINEKLLAASVNFRKELYNGTMKQ